MLPSDERIGLLLYRLLKATQAVVFTATVGASGELTGFAVAEADRASGLLPLAGAASEAFGTRLLNSIHADDQVPRLQSWRDAVLAEREIVQTTFRCQDVQGVWHWLREEAHLQPSGAEWNVVGLLTVVSVAEPPLQLVTDEPVSPRPRSRRLASRRPSALPELAYDLVKAIEREELTLSYQYQVAPATRTIVGVEALVRWRHPVHGLLFPAQFLPTAEESELMEPLGKWVFRAACQQAKRWESAGVPIRVSVNLSTHQLLLPTLLQQLAEGLAETGARPSLLGVELTEASLALAEAEIEPLIFAMKQLGIQLQLTEIGAGSSLLPLRNLPIDVLKIDQVFIQKLPQSTQDAAIVKSVIELAHGLGMKVAAEGVESSEQVEWLQATHCDILQGFYYSRPVSPEALEDVLLTGSYTLGELAQAA